MEKKQIFRVWVSSDHYPKARYKIIQKDNGNVLFDIDEYEFNQIKNKIDYEMYKVIHKTKGCNSQEIELKMEKI